MCSLLPELSSQAGKPVCFIFQFHVISQPSAVSFSSPDTKQRPTTQSQLHRLVLACATCGFVSTPHSASCLAVSECASEPVRTTHQAGLWLKYLAPQITMTSAGSGETAGLNRCSPPGSGLLWPRMNFNFVRTRLVLINANDPPARTYLTWCYHMNAHMPTWQSVKILPYNYKKIYSYRRKTDFWNIFLTNYMLPSFSFRMTSRAGSVRQTIIKHLLFFLAV